MELTQKKELQYKLSMSQKMRQSLECLRMSSSELNDWIQDMALSNPLLDAQLPTYYETAMPSEMLFEKGAEQIELNTRSTWDDRAAAGNAELPETVLVKDETFRDFLSRQIGQIRLLDGETLSLSRYLIDCLDERGYLDCSLEELSEEIGCSVFALEQALFAVQMLEPAGVGARNLSECLSLQLARGSMFNSLTLAIARDGLELLGKRDYSGLAAMLHVGTKEARSAAEAVLALSPIPSRGFPGGEQVVHIAPDATFSAERGCISVELNERILPKLSINKEYSALLDKEKDAELRRYISEKLAEAMTLIDDVNTRSDTMLKLLLQVAEFQRTYFLGGELLPMTMQQMAEKLGVNVSTVSRTVQNKYISFNGRTIPVRSLFSVAVDPNVASISAQGIKQRVLYLIQAEDVAAPLSDESICGILENQGITISRRTVAKYRAALGIPASSERRGQETSDRLRVYYLHFD